MNINFKPGTRIYYTGDMANCSSYGTITAQRPPSRFMDESVDILLDEERFEDDTDREIKGIHLGMFNPGSGQRFYLAEAYDKAHDDRMFELYGIKKEIRP